MSRCRWVFFGLFGTLLCGVAGGQVNDEIYGALKFNFSTPGARSLGMGNAFAGLVDDATAAYANPAGLLWLETKEVAAELRHSRFETYFVDGGSYSGEPTGNGMDTLDGLRFSESLATTTGVGFLSWVFPTEQWSLAIYRHEAANYRGEIAGSQGAFLDSGPIRFRIAPLQSELDLTLVDYGIAGGWKVTPSFWLGMGFVYSELDLESRSIAYDVFETFDPANGILSLSFAPTTFPPEDIVNSNSTTSSDRDFTATIGWLWRGANWSLGGAYRQGGDFDLEYAVMLGPAGHDLINAQGIAAEDLEEALTGSTEFRVPHVWSLGGAFRPNDAWTISAEIDWVEHSRLSPSANIQVSGIDLRDPDLAERPGELESYRVEDGIQYHLGIEYAILGRKSYAFRFGGWWEPDHSILYNGDFERIGARFSGGDDVLHLNAGAGLAFHDGQRQLDGAIDYSDHGTIASISMVFSY